MHVNSIYKHTERKIRLCAWSNYEEKKKHRICVFSLNRTVWGATPSTLSNLCVVVFFLLEHKRNYRTNTQSIYIHNVRGELGSREPSHTCMQALTETRTYMTTLLQRCITTTHTTHNDVNRILNYAEGERFAHFFYHERFNSIIPNALCTPSVKCMDEKRTMKH